MMHPEKRRKNKQMLEQTLIPCPFCGKEGTAMVTTAQNCEECANFQDSEKCPSYEPYVEPLFDHRGCLYRTVICNFNKGGCGASCGWYPSNEKAIEAWNRRAEIKRMKGEGKSPTWKNGKAFCGNCGGCLENKEMFSSYFVQSIRFCKWCGVPVNWSNG